MDAQQKIMILLVEDEVLIATATAHAIEGFGYDVVTARSGEEAVTLATQHEHISLILMDIDLGGGIDGTEAARQILADRHVPIVFLTSHMEEEYVSRVKAITRYGYIIKHSGDLVLKFSIEMAFELFNEHEKTRASEEKYRNLVETTEDWVWAIDTAGVLTYSNDGLKHVLGYSGSELINTFAFPIMHPDDATRWRQKLQEHIAVKTGWSNEPVRWLDKDGGIHIFESSAMPVFDTSGEVIGFHGLDRDVTERKRAEDNLRMARELSERIIEDGPVAITLVNRDGKIVFANRHAEQLFGLEKPTIQTLGYNDPKWLITDVDGSPFPNECLPFHQVMSTGQPVHDIQHAIGPPAATRKILSINGAPIHDEQGRIDKIVFAIQDITESKRSEEALRESEETYRALVEAMPDTVMRFDREGRHLFVSDNVRETVDIELERFIGKTHAELGFSEEQCRFWEDSIRRVFDSGAPFETEFRFEGKAGPVIFNWRLLPERDAKGAVTSALSISRDITAHRKAEQEYQTLFREMLDGFALHEIILEADGTPVDYRFLAVNPAFERMTGLKAGNIVGRTVLEVMPGTEGHWIEIYGKVALTGEPVHFENYSAEVGKHFEVTAFRPAEGEFACIFQDITDRKRAELALLESETRFKALHNASFGGIVIHDQGVILECNQGLSEMTGYEYSELIGMNGLLLISEKSREKVINNIRAGYEKPYEAFGLRKNGEEFPMRLEARNVPYKGKQVRTVEFRDLTEQKQAEAEKEKLQAQLSQAQKMESVGRLAGGVAHDFNNMLSIILGNTEMAMEDMAPDDPVQKILGEIFTAAKRSADITRQLLAFARKQTIAPKVIDLNDTIERMLKMLRRLIGEDIDLAWLPGANIRQVRMDPSQIDQILANLCVNARDAIADVGKITMETGNVTFDAAYCAEHPGFVPGDFVLLTVSDDGCGMDQETLTNLFEPFFSTKEVGKGTGLGLATVYGIVKQNGGFINVYSEPDQGTTFRIYLPRYRDETDIPVKKTADKIVMDGTETILLVEDEPSILNLSRMMLERYGYKVLPAGTPGEAISLAREHTGRIHLLMTDVVMPEMNGRDLAKNILSLYPDLKCLFMSGYTANVIARHGVLDEGASFIQKPFSKGDLAAKVREVLDKVSDKTQG